MEDGMLVDCELSLFAVETTRDYGLRVAQHLDLVLGEHEERAFEDGEHKIRPLIDVRRHDVFVMHSLYGEAEQSPNDKLCRLLFFIRALKDAGADRVTAVVPYLCYARKDRRTQPRDPITTKYVARLFEASGADAVITLDVHNLAAFENAFRCASTISRRYRSLSTISPGCFDMKKSRSCRQTSAALSGPSSSAVLLRPNCMTSRLPPSSRSGAVAGSSPVSCWSATWAIAQ
jgi:hypothetical protein